MISGIKCQVQCCCALLWGFRVAEGNYLTSAPWAFIILVSIEPWSTGQSSRDIRRSYGIWTGVRPVRLGFSSAQLTQMHGRKILNITFSTVTQKEETFNRPGPTTKMKRNERNRWVPQAQFRICWRVKAAGRGSEKKTVCALWKYLTESNRNKNPEERLNYLQLNSVCSIIANVRTFRTVVTWRQFLRTKLSRRLMSKKFLRDVLWWKAQEGHGKEYSRLWYEEGGKRHW